MAALTARALLALALVAGGALADAPAAAYSEREVKAAYLYNFAKFVSWPRTAGGPWPALHVCLYGENPLGPASEAIQGREVHGRTLAVRTVAPDGELGPCDILFIPASRAAALADVIARTARNPVLTVGDGAGFAERGVIINFVPEGQQLRFEINLEAARRAQLTISSRLLKLARIVRDAP